MTFYYQINILLVEFGTIGLRPPSELYSKRFLFGFVNILIFILFAIYKIKMKCLFIILKLSIDYVNKEREQLYR